MAYSYIISYVVEMRIAGWYWNVYDNIPAYNLVNEPKNGVIISLLATIDLENLPKHNKEKSALWLVTLS